MQYTFQAAEEVDYDIQAAVTLMGDAFGSAGGRVKLTGAGGAVVFNFIKDMGYPLDPPGTYPFSQTGTLAPGEYTLYWYAGSYVTLGGYHAWCSVDATFTVTPEPAAGCLFLCAGTAWFLRRRR